MINTALRTYACMQNPKIFPHYFTSETNFSKMQHLPTLIFVTLSLDKPHPFFVHCTPYIHIRSNLQFHLSFHNHRNTFTKEIFTQF